MVCTLREFSTWLAMARAVALVLLVCSLGTIELVPQFGPSRVFPRRLPTDSFPCSAEEKTCFAHNRVLHEASGKCYRLGSQGPCAEGQQFVALKEPYYTSGRIAAECRSTHLCDNRDRMRMGDGLCYDVIDSAYVNWKQCPYDKKLLLKREIFGEGSCCTSQDCLRPQSVVVQPSVPGLCYAPNIDYLLLNEDYPNVRNPLHGKQVRCSDGDVRCFSVGKLYHRKSASCYSPFESCGNQGWVVADKKMFDESSILEAVCASSPCAPGRVFMAREKQCRAVWELQNMLCSGDDIVFDIFGQAHCGRDVSQRALVSTLQLAGSSGACQLYRTTEAPHAAPVPGVPEDCAQSDSKKCNYPLDFESEKTSSSNDEK